MCGQEFEDLGAVVDQDRGKGAEVEYDTDLDEIGDVAEVEFLEQRVGDDDVSAGTDGQELGESLEDREDQHLEGIHWQQVYAKEAPPRRSGPSQGIRGCCLRSYRRLTDAASGGLLRGAWTGLRPRSHGGCSDGLVGVVEASRL